MKTSNKLTLLAALELAAIGRRTAETEWELLNLTADAES